MQSKEDTKPPRLLRPSSASIKPYALVGNVSRKVVEQDSEQSQSRNAVSR